MDVHPAIYIKTRPKEPFDLAQYAKARLPAQENPNTISVPVPVSGPVPTTQPEHDMIKGKEEEEKTSRETHDPVINESSKTEVIINMPAEEQAKVNLEAAANNSSGNWYREYMRTQQDLKQLQEQVKSAQENVLVYKRMLDHSAASMDKWQKHEGMTQMEANAQMNSMMERTHQLNDELTKAKQTQSSLEQKLAVSHKEAQRIREVLEHEKVQQAKVGAQLESVEQSLKVVKANLDKYRVAIVESARTYIRDKNDDQVRDLINTYRKRVAENPDGEKVAKQMNLQGAEILELLLKQRQLAEQLSTRAVTNDPKNLPQPHSKHQ